jgi:hypothetical protein
MLIGYPAGFLPENIKFGNLLFYIALAECSHALCEGGERKKWERNKTIKYCHFPFSTFPFPLPLHLLHSGKKIPVARIAKAFLVPMLRVGTQFRDAPRRKNRSTVS